MVFPRFSIDPVRRDGGVSCFICTCPVISRLSNVMVFDLSFCCLHCISAHLEHCFLDPGIFLMDVVGTDCGVLRFILLTMTVYSCGWLYFL